MKNQGSIAKVLKVPTSTGAYSDFEFGNVSRAEWRALINGELEKLKQRMLDEYLNKYVDTELEPAIRAAATEAAALASINPYPLLVFPTLFEEKAASAMRYHFRQRLVRDRSRRIMSIAA